MHHRVARATTRPAGSGRTRKTPALIAGLIPQATGPMADDMRDALDERRKLIEARTDAMLDTACDADDPWTKPLGQPPRDPRKAAAWRRSARTVAAYRDRYGITEESPLGPEPVSTAQKLDAVRARNALARAGEVAGQRAKITERRTLEQTSPGWSL